MFTIMLVLLFRPVGAQTEDAFPSYIEQCFNNYFNFNPQEKIYLHTDKPTYSAGENIWFRAYCVDASYHIPTQLSKFIYLELINRQDSILKRIQIKQTDSCFYGNLTIPSTTPPGEHCLRVFTNWMQNNEEDFFFKKNIQIVSTVNEVNIHTASSRQDNAIRTTLTLIDNAGKPYVHQRLKITTYRHKLAVNKTTLKTDKQGSATLQYPVTFSQKQRTVFLKGEAYFQVAHDRQKAFVVVTDDIEVKVYGTEFNINTRVADYVQTTLVRGAVSIKTERSAEKMLKPGQLAQFDRLIGETEIKNVDVSNYIGWKSGVYIFEDKSIEQIMDELSLWYDIEVFFRNNISRNRHFSGSLPRYREIDDMLKVIEKTSHVRFEVKGKTIIVD